jgi:tetratricopeptide (TPR) repeat protein
LDLLEGAERSGNISSIKAATAALEGIVPEFASKIRLLEEELVAKRAQKRIEKVQQMLADAISDQDFPAAESTLSQLKLLGGSGESIRTFRRLLDESRDATYAARFLVKAESSYSLGDLTAAVSSAKEAVEIDPSSAKAREALSLYQSEMTLMLRANVFLDQPHRLSSDNVMAEATALLAELGPFESPALSDLSVELRQLISDYSKTFTLAVTSDGVSRIELVGVGFIEPTLERRVTLSRGTYTLIARCKGHRDQAVDIDQDFELRPETTIDVSIGCGRKINY